MSNLQSPIFPDSAATLTKTQAAQTQIEAAIDCAYRGDYACCITLAAAAEGIFSNRKGSDVFTQLATDSRALARYDQKTWADTLNMEIHYLKHPAPHLPGPLTIGRMEAVIVLVRAMTKLAENEWTPKMEQAKDVLMQVFGGVAQKAP